MNYYDGISYPISIKILPMTSDADKEPEFANKEIAQIQEDYFKNHLPYDVYKFREKSIEELQGTLVLFQIKKHIVGAAVLEKRIKYSKTANGYGGHYVFYPNSIVVFDPINKEEFRTVNPTFQSFGSWIKKVELEYFPSLLALLKQKNLQPCYRYVDEEDELYQQIVEQSVPDPFFSDDKPIEIPDVVEKTSTTLPRNAAIGKQVLITSNYKCELDSAHVWFTSKVTNQNYIELHHLIPMAFQNRFSFSLDVPSNIVPLCPLCHKKLHHGTADERNPILKKLHQYRKAKLSQCKISVDYSSLIAFY